MKPIIVIPARLQASRFPNKPLAPISGIPMIIRVFEQAKKAKLGPIIVACCALEIKNVIESVGGIAILTDPQHSSGTDRIYEALTIFDPCNTFDTVLNIQGDLPVIDPAIIQDVLDALTQTKADITTLVTPIRNLEDAQNPNVVKCALTPMENTYGEALYFSRAMIPYQGPYYHHIGLYGYTRDALESFVNMPTTDLEALEKLEQLRALEHNMRIGIKIIDTMPLSVDVPDDIAKVERFIKNNIQ